MSKTKHSTCSWEPSSEDMDINQISALEQVSFKQVPFALNSLITEICRNCGNEGRPLPGGVTVELVPKR